MTAVQNQKTRNNLRKTINRYNRNLSPLGVNVHKYTFPNYFSVKYGNSHIFVETNPRLLSANLSSGNTHPNNRGKGIATMLRTFATAILRNAGFVKIRHQGAFFSNTNKNKTGGLPITTHIVRKHLGFHPVRGSNANGNYRSVWRPNNLGKKRLKRSEKLSRNRLVSLRNRNNYQRTV